MDWPHAPLHRFVDGDAIYFVTAATYLKQHFYRTAMRLDGLQSRLFGLAREHECSLQAWSIFSNHYHLVLSADGQKIREMLTRLHTVEGIDANAIDGTPGRRVWFQFRETELTFERSWLARLRYTHENPGAPSRRAGCHAVSMVFCLLVREQCSAGVCEYRQELQNRSRQRRRRLRRELRLTPAAAARSTLAHGRES